VPFLLLGHLADGGAGAAASEHGELTVINARGAVFAGMVDADHPRDRIGGRPVAGQAVGAARSRPVGGRIHRRPPLMTALAQAAVRSSEASTFQPASETPKRRQDGVSQLTG